MCNKVHHRIACDSCGYSDSEARYPDDWDNPLSCDASDEVIREHIAYLSRLREDLPNHYFDCKCLLCR